MTSTAATALDEIQTLVARHAPTDGTHPTRLDEVRLFRVSEPVERVPGVYNPSVCIVVGGAKHAYHDGRTHIYEPGHYLCATMPTPVEAEIPDATPDDPVLGIMISLESRTMSELMIQYRAGAAQPVRPTEPTTGFAVAPWDDEFTAALLRTLDLLDKQEALDLLGHGRLRELLYTIIQGPAGSIIHHTLGAPAHQLTNVLTYMRNNLDQPLAVEDLAVRAGMSRAAFDRHFKATTTLSPLRYLKALRLNDAAMLIANGTDITNAAAQVGYTSPSQFSREFKRHFGTPPRAWASTTGPADPQATAVG